MREVHTHHRSHFVYLDCPKKMFAYFVMAYIWKQLN